MNKIKSCFISIIMCLIGIMIFNHQNISASTDNFTPTSERVIIENDTIFPFYDESKGQYNVIKSSNIDDDSVSTLKISFVGVGEISFDYMVSSELYNDVFIVSIDGNILVEDSGSGNEWKNFVWYNEKEDALVEILLQYRKDVSLSRYDDCVYLKNLSFDERYYTPYIEFEIDDNKYRDVSSILYDLDNKEGIIRFRNINDDYVISVKLNGEEIDGENYEYNLNDKLDYDNEIEIRYSFGEYRERVVGFSYNANLNYVIDEKIEYINDGSYSLANYDNEIVIKSNNHINNSSSSLGFRVYGSGEFSFDYLVSSREFFDYFIVYVNGVEVFRESGLFTSFNTFKYILYDSV